MTPEQQVRLQLTCALIQSKNFDAIVNVAAYEVAPKWNHPRAIARALRRLVDPMVDTILRPEPSE
jgi:hypothetical protein